MTAQSTDNDTDRHSSPEAALVRIRAGDDKPPLFCVHARAGHLRLYENLARHLDGARAVYGLRGVLRERVPPRPYHRFEEMAERYAQEIRAVQGGGPYLLLGECEGGALAFEVARQLAAQGERVALLGLVDSFAPGEPARRGGVPQGAYRLADTARMLGFHMRTLLRLGPRAKAEYVGARLRRIVRALRMRASARRGVPSLDLLRQHAFSEAREAYTATPYAGPVVLFRGSRLPWGSQTPRDLGWAELVSELEVVELPAYFGTSILEPAARALAARLEQAVAAAAPRPLVNQA